MKKQPAITVAARLHTSLYNRLMHLIENSGVSNSNATRLIIEGALDLIEARLEDESVGLPQPLETLVLLVKQNNRGGIMGRISELEAQLQLLKKEAEEETK